MMLGDCGHASSMEVAWSAMASSSPLWKCDSLPMAHAKLACTQHSQSTACIMSWVVAAHLRSSLDQPALLVSPFACTHVACCWMPSC